MLRISTFFQFAAFALCALPLTAQVAYPDDSPLTGNGNIAPFGFSTGNTIDESRYQLLVPARYLPSTGGLITGLSTFCIPGPTQNTYASLTITMSHVTQIALGSVYASNLPAPTVVYSAIDVTLPFGQSVWAPPIPFQTPFFYDGQSDVVLSIQKVYDRARHPSPAGLMSSGTSSRSDLPSTRYNFGAFGSGASNAASSVYSSVPLKVRFEFGGLPTLRLRSDPGGQNGNIFPINGSLTLTLAAPQGTPFANLIAFGFNNTPTVIPGFGGAMWLPPFGVIPLNSGTVGASGEDALILSIPNDPSLVGVQLVFQGGYVQAGQVLWTNACDAFINS